MTGAFERLIARSPVQIADALLARVLARLGLSVFVALKSALGLLLLMLVTYPVGRPF